MSALPVIAAGAIVAGASVNVNAAPVSSAGFKTEMSSIVLTQAKQETTTEKVKAKVKRAWKRVAGYKFAVGCPVFPTLTTMTCTETGKDKEAARAKCAAQNPLCSVRETK